MKLKQEASDKLFSRAKELIPGGIFGHYKYAVREAGPKFFSKAKDAYFWDVDGNKYVDLICGWGPMILGYNNPIIDKAAQSQYSSGNTVSIASPVMIDLAETLVDMVDIADWALFGKNGGDSTQLAVMISREETGRKKVLKITGGYHGANGWMQDKGSAGTIDSDSAEVIQFHGTVLKILILQFRTSVMKLPVLFLVHTIIQLLKTVLCQIKVTGSIFKKFVIKKIF